MSWLRRLRPDGFLLAIVTSAVLASFFPARGFGMTLLHGASNVAIFLLFFLYGARIAPREALRGLAHWRLHLTILAFTFVLFPLIGLALRPLSGTWLSPQLYSGLLYLCLVPSTVQSSIAFTSIARGNVAGAIVSASASNLLGVFVTPALVVLVMAGANGRVGLGQIGDIVVQLLLPFVLGQLSQRWTAPFRQGPQRAPQARRSRRGCAGRLHRVLAGHVRAHVVAGQRPAARGAGGRVPRAARAHAGRDLVRAPQDGLLTRGPHRHPVLRNQEVPGHRTAHGPGAVRGHWRRAAGAAVDDLPSGPAHGLLGDRPAVCTGRGAHRRACHRGLG